MSHYRIKRLILKTNVVAQNVCHMRLFEIFSNTVDSSTKIHTLLVAEKAYISFRHQKENMREEKERRIGHFHA